MPGCRFVVQRVSYLCAADVVACCRTEHVREAPVGLRQIRPTGKQCVSADSMPSHDLHRLRVSLYLCGVFDNILFSEVILFKFF